MDPSMEVIQALQVLYQGTDPNARNQVNQWLQEFQKRSDAWMISDSILQKNDLSLEARLFAAQTLRTKIISDFKELDVNSALSLKDSLIQHLLFARNGSPVLRKQLCLSIADLALQLVHWQDPVKEMIERFTGDTSSVFVLLEFLSILPEEVDNNDRILIERSVYSKRANELLSMKAQDVIQLLVNCLQSPGLNIDTQVKLLVCFTSWLKSGELTLEMLQMTPLLDLAFFALESEEESVFETAVDAACGYIYECRDSEAQDDDNSESKSSVALAQKILLPKLAALAQRMKSDNAVISEGDVDRMRGYCRVFTEAGEAWVKSMVLAPANFQSLFESLILVMQMPCLEVLPMTFNFWASLTDFVVKMLDNCAPQLKKAISDVYTPVYSSLINIVIGHLRYPLDYDGFSVEGENTQLGQQVKETSVWTAKDRDDFSDFRHDIGDVLKDAVRLLGQEAALEQAYNILTARISSSSQTGTFAWQYIEAPLFALRAMGSEVNANENVIMPKIMDLLPNFPYHPKLRYASILVLGRYTEWTRAHPQYIPFQLEFISSGFDVKEVSAASTQALKFLCKDCSEFLVGYWKQLESFYASVSAGDIKLSEEDILDLTEALAHIIAAIPFEELQAALEAFCMPIIKNLERLVPLNSSDRSVLSEISSILERLSVLLRYVNSKKLNETQNLVVQLVNMLWPLLVTVVNNHATNPDISESAGRLIRVILTRYSSGNAALYTEGVQLLASAFQNTGYGVYLWAGKKFLEKNGSDLNSPANSDAVNRHVVCGMLVERFTEVMMSSVSERVLDYDKIPEPIEEFYLLITAALHTQPARTISSNSLLQALQYSLMSVKSIHYYVQEAILEMWSALAVPAVRHMYRYRDELEASVVKFSVPMNQRNSDYSADGSGGGGNLIPRYKTGDENYMNYNIERVAIIFNGCGYELAKVLFEGLLTFIFTDLVPLTASIFTSLTQLISDGTPIFKAASVANTPGYGISSADVSLQSKLENTSVDVTVYKWVVEFVEGLQQTSVLSASEKQSFLDDFYLHLTTRHWLRLRRLLTDFSSIYRRKNSSKE
ncbi:hypothetical protein BB559_006925 [Furculomyces boomerangus]|uniref:Importin N-terminal domain-containing protein n=1 Tax=Furculomyces boomerangus TaxID=61424 RepID=A0A2T9XZU5_9FUNG|nr:hypothetical protein BB559_006925 [Furculomyces boomerangus]